jgi:peptide/nickel transport system permease protein
MRRLLVLRLMNLVPVLIGVTFLSFCIINLLPGNVATQILGNDATPSAVRALSQELGLNKPLLVRYWDWIWSALHGNLGTSLLTHEGVGAAIWHAAPPTIELIIYAEIISLILTCSLSFWSVWTRSRLLDRIITSVSVAGYSLPSFVVGVVLLLIFSVKLHWVPTISYTPFSLGIGKNLESMALPSVTLALGLFPTHMRVFRGDMLEQLEHEDYVSLGWLKGLTKAQIIFHHVAKNAATGFITLLGLQLGFLAAGAVLVEQVFTINGIGTLLLTSINNEDATMVEGILLLTATVVVLANLLADVLTMLIDPRATSS